MSSRLLRRFTPCNDRKDRTMKNLKFHTNSLIVLCGPAGSGKTYFAQKYFQPSQIVSSDHFREMISDDANNQRVSLDAFELMNKIIEYRLKFNRLAVADATHILPSYRQPLLNLAKKYDRPIYLVIFESDIKTCCKNNLSRSRQVEQNVIVTQFEKFQRVKEQILSENYTEVYCVKPHEIEDIKIKFI